jgi:hypothetical protein
LEVASEADGTDAASVEATDVKYKKISGSMG